MHASHGYLWTAILLSSYTHSEASFVCALLAVSHKRKLFGSDAKPTIWSESERWHWLLAVAAHADSSPSIGWGELHMCIQRWSRTGCRYLDDQDTRGCAHRILKITKNICVSNIFNTCEPHLYRMVWICWQSFLLVHNQSTKYVLYVHSHRSDDKLQSSCVHKEKKEEKETQQTKNDHSSR